MQHSPYVSKGHKYLLFLSALALATVIGINAYGISQQSNEQKGPYTGALVFCTEGTFPPYSSMTPSGELIGLDIDIANALSHDLGQNALIKKIDWDGAITALMAKKCDALIASMAMSPERHKKIDFTDPYFPITTRFIVPKNAKITNLNTWLKGKTLGVQRGTIMEEYLRQHYPNVLLISYGYQDEVYSDLMTGRIDATLSVDYAGYYFLKSADGKNFTLYGKPVYDAVMFGPGLGIGIRKGDKEMQTNLNHALKDIKASGEYQKITKKYIDLYKP